MLYLVSETLNLLKQCFDFFCFKLNICFLLVLSSYGIGQCNNIVVVEKQRGQVVLEYRDCQW